MATSSIPVQFRIAQEPIPVPVIDDLGPVPSLSPEGQSFVVIKSAADLDEFSDDGEISGISLLHEHRQLLQDELEQFELLSTQPQPSLAKSESLQANQNSTSTSIPLQNGSSPEATTKPSSMENGSNPENKTTSDSIENGSDPEVKSTSSPVKNESDPEPKITSNSIQNGLDPKLKVSFNEIQNGSDPLKSYKDMNQSVLPAMPQPHIYTGLGLNDDDNRTISIASFAASDFGSEEIQAKVTQLIDENMHLKDIIIQNSTSMKAQYERIAAWHKDVERRHEVHKEKFREARNCIEGLRKENATLKQEIDNVRQALQLQQTEHDKTKQLLTETSQNNLKEFELDAANKKIKDLEEALQSVNLESEQKPAAESYQDMELKLARYEKELENAYKQIRDMAQGDQERSELELKLTQEKLLLSEMANERANTEIDSLRNQLARNVQTADDVTKLQVLLDGAIAGQVELQATREQLEENLRAVKEELRAGEEAAKDLKEREEEAKIDAWKAKQQLAEMEKLYQSLQRNSGAPQMPPDYNPNEHAYLRQQLMHSQKALTECEQNRAVADARSVTLNNEVVELKRQLSAKQEDTDNMFALRAQLDVYKADFEAEQEAKEEIKREKSKISNDLQLIHRRNQQLQEEVELLRDQLQQYGHHEFGMNEQPSSSGNIQPTYKCPKCNFGFQRLREVEDHVIRCIDLDDSLP